VQLGAQHRRLRQAADGRRLACNSTKVGGCVA
jgi:hypothetical protein